MLARIEQSLTSLLEWAKRQPYLGVLARAASRGISQGDKDMAASMAFFTFLSMFPLMLGLVSLGGFVLKSEEMQLRLNRFIVELLPVSADLVTPALDSIVRIRGAAGVTSVLTLIWSAKKMIGAISRAVNNALDQRSRYAIYLSSLRNFALTLLLATIIVLTLTLAPLLEVLSEMQLEFFGKRGNELIEIVGGRTSSVVATTIMVGSVYVLVPHHRLKPMEILPGLLTATVLIEIGKSLFVTYIERASSYSTVYGSMSSMIVLLIWLYLSARIVVYGAEVISVNKEGK